MMALAAAWRLSGKARIALAYFAAVVAIVFGELTVSQETMWKDDLTVFTTAHALAPRNAPVSRNLADAQVQQALQLEDEGRCGEAVPVFEQVAKDYPQDWYAWAALGVCMVQLNDLPKAEESLRRAAEISHDARVIEQWRQLRANMGLPNIALPK
jgi:tetratricopeptide (TPR) repeat protein